MVPVLGLASFNLITPISAAIILLLFIVTFSYKQTIEAFPKSSGGSYIVAKEHLGITPGLVAGASLLFDYLLTVSVSVSAGIAALTSAYQPALKYRVELTLLVVVILVLLNLRGISESSTIFAYPTYSYVLGMFLLIGIGLYKLFITGMPIPNIPVEKPLTPDISYLAMTWLVLRAFSSGCTAMTGVEAVSNAVPNFREPENKNAKKVLTLLSILLFIMFGVWQF